MSPPQNAEPPPSAAPALALFLSDRDVPCPNPKCGFILRGLKETTCPECREPLNLVVRRPEALWYMRRWVVIASLLFGIGVSIEAFTWIEFIWQFRGRLPRGVPWWRGAFAIGVSIGLIVLFLRLWMQSRGNDPRALSRFLLSFLLALAIYGVGRMTEVLRLLNIV